MRVKPPELSAYRPVSVTLIFRGQLPSPWFAARIPTAIEVSVGHLVSSHFEVGEA